MSLCTPHYRRTNYDSLAIEQCAEWTLGAVADIADGAVWPVEHPVMGKFNKTWKAKNMGVLQFVAPPTGPSLDVVDELHSPSQTSFSTLPVEIIEEIADWLRYPAPSQSGWAATKTLLVKSSAEFSTSRFDLSNLSKVCSVIRRPAERSLYQDIHLDFSGWPHERKGHYPAGNLRLLLRTLRRRPELGHLIRSVQFDLSQIPLYDDIRHAPSHRGQVFLEFLNYCPRLSRILMDQFPFGILDRFTKPLGIMTWGMMFNWESLVAVLKQLPEIRELYLMYLYELPATVPAISPFRGAQLQTLRIWDNNILTRRSKAFAQLLQLLPELRHLYVRQYDMISPENLAILPPHLRSLHIHPSPTKNELIWSLGICLLSPVMGERVVEQVMAYGLTWAEENLGTFDLTPLRAVCGEKGIVFSQTEYEVYCPEIQIFFAEHQN